MSKKQILGLDLGVTSIGFAHVIEGDSPIESSIERIGVRVNPLSTDELTDFEKGKPITINADRTLKRGMRRNLDRYQMRRDNLISILKDNQLIADDSLLVENGKQTTFQTWQLRANAVSRRIEKDELVRVLMAINKKRGYKSSRKAKSEDEGVAIDGMAIAKRLYDENITPGKLSFDLLKEGKKILPDFYRSDLQAEFDLVWNCQREFHPEIFTDEFHKEIKGKGHKATSAAFWTKYQFNTADIKDIQDSLKNERTVELNLRDKKRLQCYYWRSLATVERLEKEQAALVISEINNNLKNSSGYLGDISDRSKELYFRKQTVGQYLYEQLVQNPHCKLKSQVFYRQDYLDEFEAIWQEQCKYHSELTQKLKSEIRDVVIFYQRKLKSQKQLISFCELENREIESEVDGKKVKRKIGYKVAPKSSPLFQEFKIWQQLNNVLVKRNDTKKRSAKGVLGQDLNAEVMILPLETKELLFNELNLRGNLSSKSILELCGYKASDWSLNFSTLEGNNTNKALYESYLRIIELEGYDVKSLLKVKSNKDDVELEDISIQITLVKDIVKQFFDSLKINTEILDFNAQLSGKEFEQQESYKLWHLLYSYEGDDSKSGNDQLYDLLNRKFGFNKEHGKILANINLQSDYGSLSSKAIKKIFPYIKENQYSAACQLAGYRHSASSLTKEELESRPLAQKLELLKKNSLRNPVVEKILNQMVNVVNTLIDENKKNDPDFRFDEIRIELARELKKNSKEREELTSAINAAKIEHEKIEKILKVEFGVPNPSRNDIIRYKLYEELKSNGYKELYSDKYISREILFSKQIDVDHIIPQSRMFDDSFSNKTLAFRNDNLKKGNATAMEFIEDNFGAQEVEEFIKRIEKLYEIGLKSKEDGISKAKFLKLQKRSSEIGDGFIERDLRDSQYIAKKAKEMLFGITRRVVSTSGSITDRLREDWGLINIMQELNFEKYKKLGLTEKLEKKDGSFKERIVDWTKRNDHRHHAMDALTVAFTKQSHIQYLNHLNARYNELDKFYANIKAIELKETYVEKDDVGNNKRLFNLPIPNFRHLAKQHLEQVLVSHKAKNKVVTKNKNKIKVKGGQKIKVELTPRGQLHKETIYGKVKIPVIKEVKVSGNFDVETINMVINPIFRKLLSERLAQNDFDPKKAFTGKNSLKKNPIYLNVAQNELMPEQVKLKYFEDGYTIRKDVTPDLKIEKVVDGAVREVLEKRLHEFGNDPKKAFSDLEKNPIWMNEAKGICIKRVTISGVSNAEPLHFKRDHFGKAILDQNGSPISNDFVSTGNNHHIAIYVDESGELHDNIVSFFDAVRLKSEGLPVIDKEFNKGLGWRFVMSIKQNEFFVFPSLENDFYPSEVNLLDTDNKRLISPHLFRCQKLSRVSYGNSVVRDYVFRHHLETNVDDKKELKDHAFKSIKSLIHFNNVIKVRLNSIGEIVSVGEN